MNQEGGNLNKGTPTIAFVLALIGVLSIIGGIILCVTLWPEDPGRGYSWTSVAYIPALTWLSSGLIVDVAFFGWAAALTSQDRTSIYVEEIRRELRNIVASSAGIQHRPTEYDDRAGS